MANSKSLLVYVLALVLVVCGESWVSAKKIPIVTRELQQRQPSMPSSSSGGPYSQSYETEKEHIRTKGNVVVQDNIELTELAGVVLAAIQSGECMQRSICILGSHIGNHNRGKAVFSLVDKLIPESVQSNQYFVTMKKALKGGETFCDRFHCKFS